LRRTAIAFLHHALLLLLLTSCASAPPPEGPLAPEWDAVPAGIADAVCMRLKMDAIATGKLAIVSTTQPLATPASIGALANIVRDPKPSRRAASAQVNRAIPITLGGGTCSWNAVPVADIARHSDEMLLELSAPLPNPYSAGEAGLFARVTLGGDYANWYWLPLLPTSGGWSAGMALPLSF
jgi:hypothetical protein